MTNIRYTNAQRRKAHFNIDRAMTRVQIPFVGVGDSADGKDFRGGGLIVIVQRA